MGDLTGLRLLGQDGAEGADPLFKEGNMFAVKAEEADDHAKVAEGDGPLELLEGGIFGFRWLVAFRHNVDANEFAKNLHFLRFTVAQCTWRMSNTTRK